MSFELKFLKSPFLISSFLSCSSQPMIVETLSEKRVKMAACGEDHIGCLVGHGWVPDEEVKACMACKKSFTAIRRRVRIIIIISLHYFRYNKPTFYFIFLS